MMASIDPITCERYDFKNRLLKKDGWKRFKRYARMIPNLSRMVHQHRLKSFNSSPTYKFGIQIPSSHEDSIHLDRVNGNKKWEEAEKMELSQLDEYQVFVDLGFGTTPPSNYTKITVYIVYGIKHDGRQGQNGCRGHLTGNPIGIVYS